MDRRVDELIKQNVLLQNDLSRVNADIVQVKLQADEKVKEVYERLRVNQQQYETIVTGWYSRLYILLLLPLTTPS